LADARSPASPETPGLGKKRKTIDRIPREIFRILKKKAEGGRTAKEKTFSEKGDGVGGWFQS